MRTHITLHLLQINKMHATNNTQQQDMPDSK